MKKIKEIPSVFYFLLFVVILFSFFYVREQVLLKKCSKIFVGKYERSYSVGRGCKTAAFKYFNEGKVFHFAECEERELEKGDVVFLKVTCNQDGLGKVLWDIPVPDTLTFIPKNGWDEMPYGLGYD